MLPLTTTPRLIGARGQEKSKNEERSNDVNEHFEEKPNQNHHSGGTASNDKRNNNDANCWGWIGNEVLEPESRVFDPQRKQIFGLFPFRSCLHCTVSPPQDPTSCASGRVIIEEVSFIWVSLLCSKLLQTGSADDREVSRCSQRHQPNAE